jgi:hypothetical protein
MVTGAWMALVSIGAVLVWHIAIRRVEIEAVYERLVWPARGILIGLLLAAVLLSPGENRAFIYFQF